MFRRLKKRLKEWVEDLQRREIARLRQEAIQLKEEIERETGRPIELTPKERSRLAELSKGMDPETLKEISVFGPEQFTTVEIEKESAENS
jgi:hypothetical protein